MGTAPRLKEVTNLCAALATPAAGIPDTSAADVTDARYS